MKLKIYIEAIPSGFRVVWDEDGDAFVYKKKFTDREAAREFHNRLCDQRVRNRVNTDKIRESNKWEPG